MFVQLIEGRLADRDTFRRQFETWHTDLAPGTQGWLGSVAGVTPDGIGLIAARFASEEAARHNSEREPQSEWWQHTEACFEGGVQFTDCPRVELFEGGGSDAAGFVQVIRGRMTDVDAGVAALREYEAADERDDVLGGYVGVRPDGEFAMVVYFTSEADARAGERHATDADDDLPVRMEALLADAPRFLDLPSPWLGSP